MRCVGFGGASYQKGNAIAIHLSSLHHGLLRMWLTDGRPTVNRSSLLCKSASPAYNLGRKDICPDRTFSRNSSCPPAKGRDVTFK
jgi:hypothetical protein